MKDFSHIRNHEEYLDQWRALPKMRLTCVEKNEECRHEVGDSILFENPYDKPAGLCSALLHVCELYTWRLSLGFPSWNSDNRNIYKFHCPDPKGTVWEMEVLKKE